MSRGGQRRGWPPRLLPACPIVRNAADADLLASRLAWISDDGRDHYL